MPDWTEWEDIPKPRKRATMHSGPGVYKLRLVDPTGSPVVIPRFLAADEYGLLCIGESNNVAQRIRRFLRACEGKLKHSEGERMFLIRVKTRFGNGIYDDCRIQYSTQNKKTKMEARMQQDRLLFGYFQKHGELPPLNSVLHDSAIGESYKQ